MSAPGSGKEYLIGSITRSTLSPTEGYIMVNQIPLTAIKESWQQLVSYVPPRYFFYLMPALRKPFGQHH